jgi:hypothetical protein
LTLTNDQISEMIDDFETQARAIKTEAIRFSWYMRGGLTYSDALQLSQTEREIVSKLVDDNLETTKKSGLPFF